MKQLKPVILVLFLCYLPMIHAQKKPNIIVILTDDQGWADVGFNGATDIPTPNLDALAKEGVIFENGYVSHPYCSPSRAGILTVDIKRVLGTIVICLMMAKMMLP